MISCRFCKSLGAVAASCTDAGSGFRSCMRDRWLAGWTRSLRGRHDAHPRDPASTSRAFRLAALRVERWQQGHPTMTAPSSAPIRLVVMEGDGIGPEITAATLEVVRAADRVCKLGLTFTPVAIGLAALRAQGNTLPDAAVEAAKSADGVILGPVDHNAYPPVEQGGRNPSGGLRKLLDLYANIRPAKSRGGFPPRCGAPVDLVIARENTEGFYADRSMFLGPGEF